MLNDDLAHMLSWGQGEGYDWIIVTSGISGRGHILAPFVTAHLCVCLFALLIDLLNL